MPKGAKKRKAAKRKKQQEASNNDNSASINSHNPQGNDDPKSQDERDSDDGEVRSPVAQDHHSDQHLFYKDNEGPDEVMPSSVQSALPEDTTDATRNSRGNKLAPGDDDLVKIEGVLSYQQDSNNNSVAIQHVESTNESHDGDERSSNSSSSCSEEEEDSAAVEKKGKEEACSAVEIKAVDAFLEQVALISEYEKSVKNNDNAVAETVLDVNLDEPVVHISEMVKHESSQVENPEVLDVVESGLKESEVQLPPASSEDSAISIVAPVNDENKILPTSEEKSSISVGSTMCRNNDKMFTSTDAHPTEATNDSANVKYSDASKYAENQPLITSAPRVSQRTSWMSCCGLFDAFTGSGR